MEQRDIETLERLPSAQSSRLIDFDSVEIVSGILDDTYFLIVSGEKPWVTMTVALQPLVYVTRPDYWEIEVVATQIGIGLPMVAPYQAVLDISPYRGDRGIEIVGAKRREKYDI